MSSLKDWLQIEMPENKVVKISDRCPAITIRPITQEENSKIISRNTKKDKKGKRTLDQTKYTLELVTTAVVNPDLSNAELQKKFETLGESATLQKMLLTGEYLNLSIEVQKLSGLDVDINDDIEEVKNA